MSDAIRDTEIGERVAAMSREQRALLQARLTARRNAAAPGIAAQGSSGAVASFGQELLWLLDRSMPGSTAYNVPVSFSLTGEVDLSVLRRTLDAIVERHDVFRTTFEAVEGSVAPVVGDARAAGLEVVDVAAADADAAAFLRDQIGLRARRPFDLAVDVAFRPTLFRISSVRHVLLIVTHHIVFDGLSADVLFRELAEIYEELSAGRAMPAPAAPITYRDFAAAQRARLSGQHLENLLAYWRGQLAGVTQLDLPTDRPRSHVQTSEGAEVSIVLPADLVAGLRDVGRAGGATLYMTLIAAYAALLHRYSEQDDIVIGSPIAGRAQGETERVIGYFANTLPLRIDAGGDPTFGALLGRARNVALGALEHQDVPLEKLIMDLRREDLADTALFRCVLTMQDTVSSETRSAGGVRVALRPAEPGVARTSKFDLVLLVGEESGGLRFTLQYRTDLFDADTAERLLGHLRTVLETIVADPDARISTLPLLTEAERTQFARWNHTQTDETFESVVASFNAGAERTPEALAVACGTETLTYAELRRRADALAHRLRQTGVRRGDAVALCLAPSADMLVALLGILKAGAAYVPAPPDAGAIRIAKHISDSRARIVVSSAQHSALLPLDGLSIIEIESVERTSDVAVRDESESDDLAYIMYTSGSTGEPKGVAVTHGNIANYARAILKVLNDPKAEPAAARSFATVTTLGADLGNTSIFGALTSGAALHVIPPDVATDAERFAAYMTRHRIDVLKITPSHAEALIAALGDRAAEIVPRSWIVLGGEALHWQLVETLERIGQARILNHYGPTETTVGCATFHVRNGAARAHSATVPIGRPLDNMQLHVLDRNRQPVPIGITGELYVSGNGVARNYVGRPVETAERFAESAPIGRTYRTGDRVRRLPTGDVVFLGRSDRQVKIRGFRVELGEIEAQLASHPGIDAAAVLLSSDGHARLTAFAARAPGGADDASLGASLSLWLAQRLPAHMVPNHVQLLNALPLNANGKVDYAALAKSAATTPLAEPERVEARTPLENIILAVWSETLKNDRIGVGDNFFDLGGDSLLAVRTLGPLKPAPGNARSAARTHRCADR